MRMRIRVGSITDHAHSIARSSSSTPVDVEDVGCGAGGRAPGRIIALKDAPGCAREDSDRSAERIVV